MGAIPRPEHPFPQMERDSWMNLNGEWQFEFDFGMSGIDRKFYERECLEGKIIVPFCPESELSGIQYTDYIPAVWYKKQVEISESQKNGRILLHFGAVDYRCRVYVNQKEVGVHVGGYSSFALDITDAAVIGCNDITVYAEDDLRSGKQPKGKQSSNYYSMGCDYTRTTGIWQTVWLEFVPSQYISKVKYYPDINQGQLHIQAQVIGNGVLKAEAFFQNKSCGIKSIQISSGNGCLTIPLDEIHLWDVGTGNLYDLVLTFEEDVVKSYFGLREVKMDGMKFLLNGKSVFQRLVLDQGFYPDGIYTARTEEDLIKDIQLSLDMGFNGARLHEKVFEPRFLYHCDKMGYLVWGEHANWGLDLSSYESLKSFLPEWLEVLDRDFNHPAIIGWCPFNETWDYEGRRQRDDVLSIIYHTTKLFDTTRPCIDTSGNYHVVTDIYDVHNYEQDPEKFSSCYESFKTGGSFWDEHSQRQQYKKGLPVFVSEYGGIKWHPEEENSDAWGYGNAPKTEEEFLKRYEGLTNTLLENPNMFGFCYTQLYDVEQEVNGLYTYSRKAKFDPAVIHRINSKKASIED